MTPRLLVLLATIPPRRASCERLLGELVQQSRPPDGVILCPDGYGDALRPSCPLPAFIATTPERTGPGQRWRVAEILATETPEARPRWLACDDRSAPTLAADDILIAIDDDADLTEAPHFLRALAEAVEQGGGAAAAMGYTPDGHRAAPGNTSRGRLILGCGCGLAVRAGHLAGLQALAEEVRAAGGPDALGPCGDDQALVSAHLWRQGVPIWHAATGPLSFAPGTQRDSQTRARQARGEETLFEQAQQIARITGWPLADPVVDVEAQPVLSWEAEVSAVPRGAVRARGAAPAAGCRRVLVQDGEEPERSGVYDVPGEPVPPSQGIAP